MYITREADFQDIPQILEIHNDSIQNSSTIYTYEPQTLKTKELWFLEKKNANFPIFVAENNGIICRFSCYGSFRSASGYKYTVEDSVYVHKDHRGNGLAKILLQLLVDRAKSNGVHCMIGVIDSENTVSLRLHEQFGFIKCACIREVGHKFGTYRDAVLMQLLFDGPSNPTEIETSLI